MLGNAPKRWQRTAIVAVLVIVAGAAQVWAQVSAQTQDIAQRPTLPPTWTSTHTPTPLPTHTPTLTPSITPTLTREQLCEGFIVGDDLGSGYSYPYTDIFSLFIGTDNRTTSMEFLATHRLSGEALGLGDIPPVPLDLIRLPIASLPRPGLYDWTLQLLDSGSNVICEETGYFFAGREEWVTPTVQILPTQTPEIIIVTATPSESS